MTNIIHVDLSCGSCPVRLFEPGGANPRGTVLLFMDAFGPRPALYDIAGQLVGEGWRVLVPDLFYADLPYRPLSPASLFSGGEDRQRLHQLVAGLDQARLDQDVGGLIEHVTGRFGDGQPIAAIGYCLGGRFALTAGVLGPSVRLAGSIHGSQLAPAEGDSAHLRLMRAPGRIYVGVAENDPTFGAAEEGRLAEALRSAPGGHMIESYPGTAHGFAMNDLPVYHPAAAARHMGRLRELLADALG